MSSLKFHLRFSSSLEEKERRLFIRVIHKRKVRAISTSIYLYAHEWDKKKQAIVFNNNNKSRNDYLREADATIKATHDFIRSLCIKLDKAGDYSVHDIINAYLSYKTGSQLAPYVDRLAAELHYAGHERTARAYRTITRRLLDFAGDEQLHFESISSRLLANFEAAMRREGKSANTISFYMRNLRSVYNKATKDGIFQPGSPNLFNDVYTGVSPTRKRSLSKEEMIMLNNIKTNGIGTINPIETGHSNEALQFALDIFFFGFYARGMSFVDIVYLRKENLKEDVITYKRKKTEQMISVKVTPPMKHILDKYASKNENSPYLLPFITRGNISERLQYESALRLQNKRLKIISKLCGLNKDLSTHVARHTWASIAKSANLPLAVISEGLGHVSEKTTAIYLASFDHSVLDHANETVAQAINP